MTEKPANISAKKPKYPPVGMDEKPLMTTKQVVLQFSDLDEKNKIKATIGNLANLLDFYDIKCRYNSISKQLEVTILGIDLSLDNRLPASFAYIYSKMKEVEMPVENYREYLAYVGEMNWHNPVLEWIQTKEWDGISRIKDLCDTIKAEDNDSKNIFIERWLHQAVALATEDNVDAAGILVLQGPQGLGKTWWFKKLVPDKHNAEFVRTGASVNPNDRDSISQIIRYWIVELGEIGSTFRRADVDALKAFLTKESDILRRPYGTGDQVYPRRTALAASVNPRFYLHDETGNRRFWTVACKEVNSYHEIDMQQLWAEIYSYLKQGKNWRITAEERKLVDKINEAHLQIDPIEEMILTKYRWEFTSRENKKTSTEIAEEMGLKNINQQTTRTIANVLRKMGSEETRTGKGLKFHLPHLS